MILVALSKPGDRSHPLRESLRENQALAEGIVKCVALRTCMDGKIYGGNLVRVMGAAEKTSARLRAAASVAVR